MKHKFPIYVCVYSREGMRAEWHVSSSKLDSGPFSHHSEIEIQIDLPDPIPTQGLIENLKAEIAEIRKESQEKVMAIEDAISKLLYLEG